MRGGDPLSDSPPLQLTPLTSYPVFDCSGSGPDAPPAFECSGSGPDYYAYFHKYDDAKKYRYLSVINNLYSLINHLYCFPMSYYKKYALP